MIFGNLEELGFVFYDRSGGDNLVSRTTGLVELWINDELVWGEHAAGNTVIPFSWSWYDLLVFLADAWPYLKSNEELQLFEKIKKISADKNRSETEDEMLHDFLSVHDFSRGVEGAWPESVILVRDHNKMVIEFKGKKVELDFKETMQTLAFIGNYLHSLVKDLEPAREICLRWDSRNILEKRDLEESSKG